MIAYAHESRCPSCGREISDAEARFCAGCGVALDAGSATGRPILSAVDADDPQDARTRLGIERVAGLGRSTISPGASLRAVGQTTRTRRSQRVGRPTRASHDEYEKQAAINDAPAIVHRNEPDLDLVASRGLDPSLAPEPEPFPPRDAHFDGDPFFDDVFHGEPERGHGGHSAASRREPEPRAPEDAPAVELDLDLDGDVLGVAAIQRARRTRAFVGVAVALTAVGAALVLAL
ncbi:MAG: hypothetical protein CVU56_01055 [Deltaproteobacteria bacterium HGW-Deltaproteobacteria-14]|nr:MAG: hypothetical protein CVU56_01055 [Deltaproteobacteria bacterium HGW-Deltaproteobacteria-14]